MAKSLISALFKEEGIISNAASHYVSIWLMSFTIVHIL